MLTVVVVSNDVTLKVSCVCVGCVTIEVTTILEGSLFFKKICLFVGCDLAVVVVSNDVMLKVSCMCVKRDFF